MKTKYYLLLLFSILISSCMKHIQPLDPVFADMDKFKYEFSSLIKAEHVNIDGKLTTSGSDSTTELQINIINAQNIPTDDERKSLGKVLSKTVKSNLKDAEQFQNYKVKYSTSSEGGGVKVDKYISYSFNSKEL
jgi:hypothetical protein